MRLGARRPERALARAGAALWIALGAAVLALVSLGLGLRLA